MADLTSEYAVLNPEWQLRLRTDRHIPTINVLRRRLRESSGRNYTTHQFAALRAGKPVPAALVNALARLLLGAGCGDAMANPTDEPPEQERGRDVWTCSFPEMVAELLGGIRCPPDASFPRDDGEVDQLADGILLTLGRWQTGKVNRRIPETVAYPTAEQITGRTREEFRAWLRKLWAWEEKMVMFACAGGQRIGATVIIPLAEPSAQAFRVGGLDPCDIAEKDIQLGSRHLLLAAVGERTDIDLRACAKIGMAHMRNIFYQGGVLGDDQGVRGSVFHLLAFCGYGDAQKRLESKGFSPVGALTPVGKKVIMEMTKPPRYDFLRRLNYDILRCYFTAYRTQADQEVLA